MHQWLCGRQDWPAGGMGGDPTCRDREMRISRLAGGLIEAITRLLGRGNKVWILDFNVIPMGQLPRHNGLLRRVRDIRPPNRTKLLI